MEACTCNHTPNITRAAYLDGIAYHIQIDVFFHLCHIKISCILGIANYCKWKYLSLNDLAYIINLCKKVWKQYQKIVAHQYKLSQVRNSGPESFQQENIFRNIIFSSFYWILN